MNERTPTLPARANSANLAETAAQSPVQARSGVPESASAPVLVGRTQAVDMGPTVIPFLFGALILALAFLGPDERRSEVRRRLSRDKDYYLSLALVPVVLVVLSYLLSPRTWPVWVAWLSLPVVSVIALRWLLGEDRRPDLTEGIDLPEDLRSKLDD
jgi:hypothetical protein